ncbi:hypothetical protein L1987_15100 [Smallanthus sonchifolius]|uniref:Uncharacterized protein n=1 Tax=Smallanthus sonchifolius TaxID=185202 RepID=A0ACB9J6X1_9ASTR|nr:hypothetical protein L1987_15100 [Smallanthus sonchifolius]
MLFITCYDARKERLNEDQKTSTTRVPLSKAKSGHKNTDPKKLEHKRKNGKSQPQTEAMQLVQPRVDKFKIKTPKKVDPNIQRRDNIKDNHEFPSKIKQKIIHKVSTRVVPFIDTSSCPIRFGTGRACPSARGRAPSRYSSLEESVTSWAFRATTSEYGGTGHGQLRHGSCLYVAWLKNGQNLPFFPCSNSPN